MQIQCLFPPSSLQNREIGESANRILKRLNVQKALDSLTKRHKVKLDGITSDSIVSGRKNQILGLVWTLFVHFQLPDGSDDGNGQENSKAQDLLSWAQAAIEP